jgi:Fe-S cluster biogenesis protein NfuA
MAQQGLTDWTVRVQSVVNVLVAPLRTDGADVAVTACDPDTGELHIDYTPGTCTTCTMSGPDLGRLLEDGLRTAVGSEVRVIVREG